MMDRNSTYELSNGVKIPVLGFGTWQSADGDEAYNAVLTALRAGYRHIDTAAAYENEESVGKAINDFMKESGVSRKDLFVTTKLWNGDHGRTLTEKAIDSSLSKLGLDYLDLYLIHWPNPLKFRDCWEEKNAESWKEMEDAVKDGKIRAIGLSNFWEHHIEALLKTASIKPVVNQIKICPGQSQRKLVEYSKKLGMVMEGYSPLGTGAIFANEFMKSLSEKYKRSIAQICIRWSIQSGCIPLPKSVTESRIKENLNVFDFELDAEDIEKIANLKCDIKLARNPDEAPF